MHSVPKYTTDKSQYLILWNKPFGTYQQPPDPLRTPNGYTLEIDTDHLEIEKENYFKGEKQKTNAYTASGDGFVKCIRVREKICH